MKRGVESRHDGSSGDGEAPLCLDELLDPSLAFSLSLICVIRLSTGQILDVLGMRCEPGRLNKVSGIRRQSPVQVLVPPVVFRVRVGRPPHAPVRRPAVLRGRVTTETRRQGVHDLSRYLYELIEDGE